MRTKNKMTKNNGEVSIGRRRLLSAISTSLLLRTVPPIAGAALTSLSRPVKAEIATAIAACEAAIALINHFSEQGDGGLGAMLSANLAYQHETLMLLIKVTEQIAGIQGQIAKLRDYIPIALEHDRLITYFDEVRAGAAQTARLLDAAPVTKAQKMAWRSDLERVLEKVSHSSAKLQLYSSFDASVAYALCAATEVALLFKTDRGYRAAETLRAYSNWSDRILGDDPSSLQSSLFSKAAQYENFLKKHSTVIAGSQYHLDCMAAAIMDRHFTAARTEETEVLLSIDRYATPHLLENEARDRRYWTIDRPLVFKLQRDPNFRAAGCITGPLIIRSRDRPNFGLLRVGVNGTTITPIPAPDVNIQFSDGVPADQSTSLFLSRIRLTPVLAGQLIAGSPQFVELPMHLPSEDATMPQGKTDGLSTFDEDFIQVANRQLTSLALLAKMCTAMENARSSVNLQLSGLGG